MIRLPSTGIAISQNDLHVQLQHLDTYTGLLKQGFKKDEIVRYFRDRDPLPENSLAGDTPSPLIELPPSTYDLVSQSKKSESTSPPAPPNQEFLEETEHHFASPIRSPPQDFMLHETQAGSRRVSFEVEPIPTRSMHAPRQSSLLRFARRMSSEASDLEQHTTAPFAQRLGVTYRPRSETYSYDQSEIDEDTTTTADFATPIDELQNLSLHAHDLSISSDSNRATTPTISTLRPDAKPFVPSSDQVVHRPDPSQHTSESSSSDVDTSSFPSSPPVAVRRPIVLDQDSASPGVLPHTPRLSPRNTRTMIDLMQTQQRFLDGTFSVYNDSLPAIIQPQTSADLSRIRHLTEYSAAFTAPPGMVRSGTARQDAVRQRQTSGELSPAARAAMMRERRQREFVRGLRVEGLRIDRLRNDTRDSILHSRTHVDTTGFWRDDLDADSVGEENFEESSFAAPSRGMRAVSGNRRAI